MSDLIILGASVRAAAFSALRAGLRPWCADLFADMDLRAHCPAVRLTGRYPDGFEPLLASAPDLPWLYTGGLENYPRLVTRLARIRCLWGNNVPSLFVVRNPEFVANATRSIGLPAPEVRRSLFGTPLDRRWLRKPRLGAGGHGIRFASEFETEPIPASVYFQEYVEGESRSILYCADPERTELLGVTRQLIGEAWLHAAPFHYCGSVGPLNLNETEKTSLTKLGTTLAQRFSLRGLFGVDGIWRDGTFRPVEVNPRYTASVEVLELATGMATLARHRHAFDRNAPVTPVVPRDGSIVGKAILFAAKTITIPRTEPWNVVAGMEEPLSLADQPDPGRQIEARRPIVTCFARAGDVASVIEALKERARRLYEGL